MMAYATLEERGNTCGGPAKAIVESAVKGKAGVVEPTESLGRPDDWRRSA